MCNTVKQSLNQRREQSLGGELGHEGIKIKWLGGTWMYRRTEPLWRRVG